MIFGLLPPPVDLDLFNSFLFCTRAFAKEDLHLEFRVDGEGVRGGKHVYAIRQVETAAGLTLRGGFFELAQDGEGAI